MTQEAQIVSRLRKVTVPDAFSSREQAQRFFTEGKSVEELEREKFSKIVEVLTHPELETLIQENKITLGIIKPHANEGVNLSDDDDQAAETILDEIGRDDVIFSLSLRLTKQQAEQFYDSNKESQQAIPDEADPSRTVWDSVTEFTSSGPLTFVLIYRSQGDAIEWWREQMGPTNPQIAREERPDSIRGKHAQGLPNNIVHGSDSIESAKREIGVLADILSTQI